MHVSQCINHVSTFQAQCHRSDNVFWDSLGLKEQILTNYQFPHHLSQVLCIGYMHRGCQLLPQAFILILLTGLPPLWWASCRTWSSRDNSVHSCSKLTTPKWEEERNKKYKEGNVTFLHLHRFPASPSKLHHLSRAFVSPSCGQGCTELFTSGDGWGECVPHHTVSVVKSSWYSSFSFTHHLTKTFWNTFLNKNLHYLREFIFITWLESAHMEAKLRN